MVVNYLNKYLVLKGNPAYNSWMDDHGFVVNRSYGCLGFIKNGNNVPDTILLINAAGIIKSIVYSEDKFKLED